MRANMCMCIYSILPFTSDTIYYLLCTQPLQIPKKKLDLTFFSKKKKVNSTI